MNPEHVIAHVAPGGKLAMETEGRDRPRLRAGQTRPASSETKNIGRWS
jgi:DNA-directed RNA polymerase subunit alpha